MNTYTLPIKEGQSIRLHFFLENELPYKEIIEPDYAHSWIEKSQHEALYIKLTQEELNLSDRANMLPNIHLLPGEIWLECANCYIVMTDLNKTIVSRLEENKLVIYFFDENEDFVRGRSFKIKSL